MLQAAASPWQPQKLMLSCLFLRSPCLVQQQTNAELREQVLMLGEKVGGWFSGWVVAPLSA